MVRTNQGGSILGFIVIGGIMALLFVGGAYFVRQNLASNDRTDRNGEVISLDDNDESTQSSEEETDEAENTDRQPNQDEDESIFERDNDSPMPQTGQESETPENLPETGPADILLTGILLSGIVAAATAYARSRDTIASL